MDSIRRFEDIVAWQRARILTREVYAACRTNPFCQDHGLVNQITRAAVSIMSNIAEGFERNNNREFIQYLYYAKASAGEVRCQLYVAIDQSYINNQRFEEMRNMAIEINRMIIKLIHYLQKSDITGPRFKDV
jgi:four helix bundle protein